MTNDEAMAFAGIVVLGVGVVVLLIAMFGGER